MKSSVELSNGSIIGAGGVTNLRRTQKMSVEALNGSVGDTEGGCDPSSTRTMSMMEHLSLELLEDGLDSFRTIHIRNQQNHMRNKRNDILNHQDHRGDDIIAGNVQAAIEEESKDLSEIKSVAESRFLASEKVLSTRDTFEGRSRTQPTTRNLRPDERPDRPVDPRTMWYCGHCHWGPMIKKIDHACTNCHKWKDDTAYSPQPRTSRRY